jgi:glycosyltransferase involved in cell wall biosynthesis
MKILILTQKIDKNDDVLGFMHGWISEFAKNCERVTAISLQQGEHGLPSNVKVLSLGKEGGRSRIKYIWNFYKYIWQEKNNYDAVFVHMNPEYVVLGGLFWKFLGKKISLWYAHKSTPWHLKLAEKFVDVIFTSTESGCKIKSKKIKVIGQGIDTELFKPEENRKENEVFNIITVGRLSKSKDYGTLLLAVKDLTFAGIRLKVDIIGAPARPEDFAYLKELESSVATNKMQTVVTFVGSVSNREIIKYLKRADLFVNMGQTGSLDKAVLEAMSAGIPILTCNEAFKGVLGLFSDDLMVPKHDHSLLENNIRKMYEKTPEERALLGLELRRIIVEDHNLGNFVSKIVKGLREI